VTRRKADARRKVDGKPINFFVFYEIDSKEARHALSLDNYLRDAAAAYDAEIEADTWVIVGGTAAAAGVAAAAAGAAAAAAAD